MANTWGGGASSLAATLAVGHDTNGIGISDSHANAIATMTAMPPSIGGNGDASINAFDAGVTLAQHNATIAALTADASSTATGHDSATTKRTATAAGASSGDADSGAAAQSTDGSATVAITAQVNSGGTANATATAVSDAGTVSFGPIADVTRADLQCNGATLYSAAAAAPTTFATLFYRDTTAVTGRMYMWNFTTAAYVAISGVF